MCKHTCVLRPCMYLIILSSLFFIGVLVLSYYYSAVTVKFIIFRVTSYTSLSISSWFISVLQPCIPTILHRFTRATTTTTVSDTATVTATVTVTVTVTDSVTLTVTATVNIVVGVTFTDTFTCTGILLLRNTGRSCLSIFMLFLMSLNGPSYSNHTQHLAEPKVASVIIKA